YVELGWVAGELDVVADGAADGVGVGRDDAAELGEGDGEQDEVEAAEPEAKAEEADEGAEDRRQRAAHEHADPGRDPLLDREQGRGVSADAQQGRVARRELAGVAAHEAPRLAENPGA